MNPSPQSETEAIRSDIDVTRQRMDDTMDAIGDRLRPRHLLDEFLGFLRGGDSDGGESRLTHYREKLSESCNTAAHNVADVVKKNPVPLLLIGAGVGWMIYQNRRENSPRAATDPDLYSDDNSEQSILYDPDPDMTYDPDIHYDRPLEYPSQSTSGIGYSNQSGSAYGGEQGSPSKLGEIKGKIGEKASAVSHQVRDKLAGAGEVAKEKVSAVRERAGEITSRAKDSTRQVYSRARTQVVTTADQHPLEVGLVALAAGLIAGLMLPTPNVINRRVGPVADRLRTRTRERGAEMLEKGKRVAEAAVHAAKDEAQAQGLTPERLREKASAVADSAKEAGGQTARQEGLASDAQSGRTGNSPSDPSPARPVA
jgi:ElaB/YqjD/DUF883 family membrane-anchored ribosome-binding protein